MRPMPIPAFAAAPLLAAMMFAPAAHAGTESVCHGSPGAGRIEHAVRLPASGPNFEAYSPEGVRQGRIYVHSVVRDILLDAYAQTRRTHADVRFVYGETGLRNGGPMPPHRSHQAGVSVDLLVPVRDRHGNAVQLPRSRDDLYGYAHEFDARGRLAALRIDFDAVADHLYHLDRAARRHGAALSRVIFDPELTRLLLRARGADRIRHLPFVRKPVWIRHDEHYHVDFDVGCRR